MSYQKSKYSSSSIGGILNSLSCHNTMRPSEKDWKAITDDFATRLQKESSRWRAQLKKTVSQVQTESGKWRIEAQNLMCIFAVFLGSLLIIYFIFSMAGWYENRKERVARLDFHQRNFQNFLNTQIERLLSENRLPNRWIKVERNYCYDKILGEASLILQIQNTKEKLTYSYLITGHLENDRQIYKQKGDLLTVPSSWISPTIVNFFALVGVLYTFLAIKSDCMKGSYNDSCFYKPWSYF